MRSLAYYAFRAFLCALLSLCTSSQAQSIKGMNYQAVARDGSGLLMPNANVNLRFAILEGSEAGPSVYEETHAVTTNAYSLFSVVIGEGNVASGDFATIAWASNDYFLRVEVNGAPVGSTRLESVPYSKVATQMDASQLTDVDASGAAAGDVLKYDGTNWVAGSDETADGDVDAANEIQTLSLSGSTLSLSDGGGSVNLPASSTPWLTAGNNVHYSNGRVGIGTSNPLDGLHISDPGNEGDVMIQNTYPFLTFRTTSNNNAGIHWENSSGTGKSWFYHSSSPNVLIMGHGVSSPTPSLVIEPTGHVGFGTTNPTAQIHIIGTANTASARLTINSLEIQDMGTSSLGLDGDIIPFSSTAFDLGNNVVGEHWDDVVASTFTTFSDLRLKNQVQDLKAGLQQIMLLRPVQYVYNTEIDLDQRLRYGLIAQEVEEVLPNVVIQEDIDVNSDTGEIIRTQTEYKAMTYMDLIPVLIQAVQEQQAQIETLKEEIQSLQNQ